MCAVGVGPDNLGASASFPTTTPDETLDRAARFFRQQGSLGAIGIASFGPLDLDPGSATFGSITTTPKPGWAHTDVVGPFKRALGVPVAIDTDVNAAALAEHRWGAGRGFDPLVYVTVGTGIGGGAVVHGKLLHGLVHPEMGHVRVPHDLNQDSFPGVCGYHGDCLEGLASGPAIAARWNQGADTFPSDHPAWELEARYLALGIVAIVGVLSPRRIVLGGGVMQRRELFPMIRARVTELLAGYVQSPAIVKEIDGYIVPPALGDRAGVLGAIALATDASGIRHDAEVKRHEPR